jgi:hypothetical protein
MTISSGINVAIKVESEKCYMINTGWVVCAMSLSDPDTKNLSCVAGCVLCLVLHRVSNSGDTVIDATGISALCQRRHYGTIQDAGPLIISLNPLDSRNTSTRFAKSP